MSHMTPQPEKARRKPKLITLIIAACIMVALVVLGVMFWQPLAQLMSDPERTRQLIAGAGPWGPVIFMLLQVVQVLIAPIPGQVTGFVGGYLFGGLWGTVYATIGATIGFTLIFVLARKLGRPFVEYFVDKKLLQKFDYLTERNGVLVFFLIFLLPAFPDDIICYLAGLTAIKIRVLILISFIGRLPGNVLLAITGSGVAESNVQLVVIIASVLVAVGAFGFWQRARIERWVKKISARGGQKGSKDER